MVRVSRHVAGFGLLEELSSTDIKGRLGGQQSGLGDGHRRGQAVGAPPELQRQVDMTRGDGAEAGAREEEERGRVETGEGVEAEGRGDSGGEEEKVWHLLLIARSV
jgi:hypothetical protein